MKDIARLPVDNGGNDEYCSVCSDDCVLVVIEGETNCGYCGNQVNLCSKCFYKAMREIKKLKICDDYHE